MSPEAKVNDKELYKRIEKLVLNLLNITKPELSMLMEKIKQSKGKIRISMHPNSLLLHEHGLDYYRKYFLGEIMMEHAVDFINDEREDIRPTFVFVERDLFDKLQDMLEQALGNNLIKTGIVLIPTKPDMGEPDNLFNEEWSKFAREVFGIDLNKSKELPKERLEMINSFRSFCFLLSLLHVSEIEVSGGYVGARSFYDADLDRCLGTLISFLRREKFKVRLSDNVLYKDGLSKYYLKDVGEVDEDGNFK